MDLVKEAIIKALKPVEGEPEIWLNPEKGVLTRFVTEDQKLRKEIVLYDDEKPIFEYSSPNSYSLITSQRVISIKQDVFYEMSLIDIVSTRPLIPKNEYSNIKPWTMFWVKDCNGNEFLIEFDQINPTYFALMLVSQLSSMLRSGKWAESK